MNSVTISWRSARTKLMSGILPEIDVVIPAFNRADTIGQTIESVLAQRHVPSSIVVVDDGSSDNTARVAGSFPGVTVLSQQNSGVGAARNAGAALGRSEWVAFVDSDDWWHPEFLAELAASVVSVDRSVIAAYCRVASVDAAGNRIPGLTANAPVNALVRLLRLRTLATPSSTIVARRQFAELGGFCTDRIVGPTADWILWCRLAASGQFAYVPQTLAYHRTHGSNMMSDPDRMFAATSAAIDIVYGDRGLPAAARKMEHETRARALVVDAINRYAAGQMSRARRQLGEAVRSAPGLLLDPAVSWTFARSLLGARATSRLRSLKYRVMGVLSDHARRSTH